MGLKKAQVTIFIVAGIFLLVIAGLVIYVISSAKTAVAPTSNLAKPVSEFLQVCADNAAYESVRLVSRQGGYYIPPKESSLLNGFVVADYYRDAPRVPGMDTIDSELARAAKESFAGCDLAGLGDLGYNVTISNAEVTAYASGIGVRFRYSYGAVINGENEAAIETGSESFVPAELAKSYGVASKFVEEQAKDPRYIPLTYLSDLCVSNLLVYEMHQESDHVVYTLVNNARKLKDEPYTYAFSVNYGKDRAYFNRQEVVETPVFTAPAGKVFYYRLNYTDAYAYTELFNATSGEIRFTPKQEDIGMHEVLVIANTTQGWITMKMNLNITEGDDA
jgi:hypothetical protein